MHHQLRRVTCEATLFELLADILTSTRKINKCWRGVAETPMQTAVVEDGISSARIGRGMVCVLTEMQDDPEAESEVRYEKRIDRAGFYH